MSSFILLCSGMFKNTPDIPSLLCCFFGGSMFSLEIKLCSGTLHWMTHICSLLLSKHLCVWKKSWDDYTIVCGCAVNLNAWILCELGDQNVAILEGKRMQDFILSSLWMSHELWKYYKQLTQVELKPLFKHDCMCEFWRICKVEKTEMSNGWHYWLCCLLNVIESSLCFVCAVSVHRPMLHDHILFDF